MTTAELAAKLLLVLEGKRLISYPDSRGVWTIGIGHTKDIGPKMIATPEQVAAWFAEDQAPLLALVADKPVLEAAALVSFGFNCGVPALERVLAGKAHIEEFIYSGGSPTLQPRRELEAALIAVSRGL